MRQAIEQLIAANEKTIDKICCAPCNSDGDKEWCVLQDQNSKLQSILDKDASNALQACEDAL